MQLNPRTPKRGTYAFVGGCYIVQGGKQETTKTPPYLVTRYTANTAMQNQKEPIHIVISGEVDLIRPYSLIQITKGRVEVESSSMTITAEARHLTVIVRAPLGPAAQDVAQLLSGAESLQTVIHVAGTVSGADSLEEPGPQGKIWGYWDLTCSNGLMVRAFFSRSAFELVEESIQRFPKGAHVRTQGRILRLSEGLLEVEVVQQQFVQYRRPIKPMPKKAKNPESLPPEKNTHDKMDPKIEQEQTHTSDPSALQLGNEFTD